VGDPPRDYVGWVYLEWYGEENGRVVIELNREQVQVIGSPIPPCESDPISRKAQASRMSRFLADMGRAMHTRSGDE
jgi:hypothetical protein